MLERRNLRYLSASSESSHPTSNCTSSAHDSVFGNISFMQPLEASLSILMVIAAVLLFEHIFTVVHELTVDTPFDAMVIAIKNEMMIGMVYISKIFF